MYIYFKSVSACGEIWVSLSRALNVCFAGWGCCRFPISQISWFQMMLMMMTMVMVGGLLPLMLRWLNITHISTGILYEIVHTLERWCCQFPCLFAIVFAIGVEKITHFLIPTTATATNTGCHFVRDIPTQNVCIRMISKRDQLVEHTIQCKMRKHLRETWDSSLWFV